MIYIKQLTKNNILIPTPTTGFNTYQEIVTWLNANVANIFTFTDPNITVAPTTDRYSWETTCIDCFDTLKCMSVPSTPGTYELTILPDGSISRTTTSNPVTFGCSDVTTCINTNAGTQTAIRNLIGTYLNLPTTPGTYELVFNGTTYSWSNAVSGGTFTCADVENCVRTNAGVQDAIRDLIFGDGNTTLCAAITAAGCTVGGGGSSFTFSNVVSFSQSGNGTPVPSTITSSAPITGLHIKGHMGSNDGGGTQAYSGGNVDLYYDAGSNILYGTVVGQYGGISSGYAAGNEYYVGGINSNITFNTGIPNYASTSVNVVELTPNSFRVDFGRHPGTNWVFTGIIQAFN